MVLEHALLDVRPGEEAAFEAAFAQAKQVIAAAPGCRWVRLERCVERPATYLLLVGWERLEDHTEGFRGSPAFVEWRGLVGGFWEPLPTVEHFTPVDAAGDPPAL